jgi:large subunit ribosomal protein L5
MAKDKDKEAKPKQQEAQQPKAPRKEQQAKKPVAPPVETGPQQPAPPARLAVQYRDKIVPDMMKKFGYTSVMQVPRIKKIVINMGVGEAVNDKKVLDFAVGDMTRIAGQKPVVTKTRKSIANFKVRAGYPVGCMVTLRGARMYEFLDRLVNIAIPRIRDFRGVSNRAFDGRGSYSLGVKEQIIFPEIEYDKIDALRGLDIAINTTARNDDEARALLTAFRFPFRVEQPRPDQKRQETQSQEPQMQAQKG